MLAAVVLIVTARHPVIVLASPSSLVRLVTREVTTAGGSAGQLFDRQSLSVGIT